MTGNVFALSVSDRRLGGYLLSPLKMCDLSLSSLDDINPDKTARSSGILIGSRDRPRWLDLIKFEL